jgi:hypothetical protein
MNINWKWPETKHNNRVPWYTIVRRAIFFVPVFFFLFISLGFVYLGWGKDAMFDLWRDIT